MPDKALGQNAQQGRRAEMLHKGRSFGLRLVEATVAEGTLPLEADAYEADEAGVCEATMSTMSKAIVSKALVMKLVR